MGEMLLVRLLDTLSPLEDNKAALYVIDLVQSLFLIVHSKYNDDVSFNNALQSYNSKISMLSLNCLSITCSAKFDKYKLLLMM